MSDSKLRRTRFTTAAILAVAVFALAFGLATASPSQSASDEGQKVQAAAPMDASLARSADRLDLIQQLRDVATANPSRYGGVSTAGDQQVVVCDRGQGTDRAMENPAAALRASGARVDFRPCKHSLAELDAILATVPDSPVFDSFGVRLVWWGIDSASNTVLVGVNSIPTGLLQKIETLWGDAVTVEVREPLASFAG